MTSEVPEPPRIEVEASRSVAPYEQVRRQFADLIESGVLIAGIRLPPVRQLAGDLGLAVGTVARAYSELEAAGLVVTRRGGGTIVAPIRKPTDAEAKAQLDEHARVFALSARRLGATNDRALAVVRQALADSER